MRPRIVGQQFVPEMLDPILGDYARSVPDARDAEVLSLFATIVERLQGEVTSHVPRIFEAVFDPTLQMITRNFEDFVTWVDTSKIKRKVAAYNDKLDDYDLLNA